MVTVNYLEFIDEPTFQLSIMKTDKRNTEAA